MGGFRSGKSPKAEPHASFVVGNGLLRGIFKTMADRLYVVSVLQLLEKAKVLERDYCGAVLEQLDAFALSNERPKVVWKPGETDHAPNSTPSSG